MGHGYVGITEPVKIFSKIRNPMGALPPQLPSLRKKPLCRTLPTTMKQVPNSFVGTVVTGESELPNWLSVPDTTSNAKAARELLHLQYENMFENFI